MKSIIFFLFLFITLVSCQKVETTCDSNKIVHCVHITYNYLWCNGGEFINVTELRDSSDRNECDAMDLIGDVQRLNQESIELAKQNHDTIGVLWLTQYPPKCDCK